MFLFLFICLLLTEYEVAFDKFATDGVLQYNDIKKFFESVGHVPSQKEIDEAIEIVTKSKRRAVKFLFVVCFVEQERRSGESARLPPMWPGFDSGPVPYAGWVCCWFLSLLRGFFSRFSGFPSSTKTNISNFQLDQDRGLTWKPAKTAVASSLNVVTYLFTLFISHCEILREFNQVASLWASFSTQSPLRIMVELFLTQNIPPRGSFNNNRLKFNLSTLTLSKKKHRERLSSKSELRSNDSFFAPSNFQIGVGQKNVSFHRQPRLQINH